MESPLAEDDQRVEPAVQSEATAEREVRDPEERRHLQEVRAQDEVVEPNYDGESGGRIEGHGSQGSQVDSLRPLDGVESTSGGQPPQTSASEAAVHGDPPETGRPASVERRAEDVSQVQRSLNFMTGLLTSLTDRVGRVEQWQSATGSTAGGGAGSAGESSAMTPVTPQAGLFAWADVDRLNQQLAGLRVGEGSDVGGMGMMRPLASTARIMEGTFSSDSSETARRRAEEAKRGVPGALLGPLALADRPFFLEGDPLAGDSESGRGQPILDSVVTRTVEAVMRSQAPEGREAPREPERRSTSSLPRMTESQSMSSPPGITEPLSTSSLPRMKESQSMSSPPGITASSSAWPCQGTSGPPGTSQVTVPLSMPPVLQTMECQSMSRPSTTMEPQSFGPCLRNMGPSSTWPGSSLPVCASGWSGAGPTVEEVIQREEELRRRWLLQEWDHRQGLGVRGPGGDLGRYVGCEGVSGSPVSMRDLPPPPPRPPVETTRMGPVIGAPPQGLVCLRGAWHPYTMVQGQMVVQFDPSENAAEAIPPPPPLPPPPTTPKAGTSGASSSTPGGTPVPLWSPDVSTPLPPVPQPATSTAASVVDAGMSEEPSKLVTKLPTLASARGGDAAVIAGDWLAQLEPSMSSLSPSAATWWRQLMDRVKALYTTWLESAPVTRLSLRQSVLSQRPAQDKHQRVEQRAAVLLLESLPDELRHEVVSVRAVTVEAMIFLVHCAYQPGGAGEKAHLLQFLTSPDVGSGLDGTLQLARKWVRLLRRGRELQLVLPDPSLLCRGLDRVVSSTFAGNKHPSATFRIASFKLERQLDYKATLVDAEDYAYLVVGELEAALLAQPLPPPPKVARMDDQGGAGEPADKGKGKGKGKKACWGWQDGTGCRFGANCLFMHAPLGPGRCWECGSDAHLKPQCPLLGQGGKASVGGATGSGKGSGGAAQGASGGGGVPNSSSSSTSATAGGAAGPVEDKPPKKPKRKGGGKDRGPKDAVRKTEEEAASAEPANPSAAPAGGEDAAARTEFFEEATKALKSLRLAKITLQALQCSSGGRGRALVDSGATTSMRTARGGEVRGLPLRKVLLAEGETAFYQLPDGTLLTTKASAPIVAMSDLMEVGCRVTWCSAEGCKVVHPVRGDLSACVVNGCPEVDEEVGLELIEEAEAIKLRRREAELAVNRLVEGCDMVRMSERKLDWEMGAKAVKDLRNGVGLSWAWLHQTFPEAPSWLISAIPVVAEVDGERVPWNRHERKRWKRASAVAVHLFCGKDRSTWKSRAEAAHVVTVDQAEDLMADATYSALLELALSGRIRSVFGGPPCRTFSALRNKVMDVGEGPRPLRDREGDGRWAEVA